MDDQRDDVMFCDDGWIDNDVAWTSEEPFFLTGALSFSVSWWYVV